MSNSRNRTIILGAVILCLVMYGLIDRCWGQSCWGENTYGLREADLSGIVFTSLTYLTSLPLALKTTVEHKHYALYLALFLTPIFTFSVVLEIVKVFASESLARIRLRAWNDHIVVVGGGARTRALILDCIDENRKVVVFSDGLTSETIGICHINSVPILHGPISDINLMKRARLSKALHIVFACEDDLKNLQGAVFVKSFLQENYSSIALKDRTLQYVALGSDLQSLINPNSREQTSDTGIRIDIVDLASITARQFTENTSIYADALERNNESIHLVFVGFHQYSNVLMKQILKTSLHSKLKLPKVTIITDDPVEAEQQLSFDLPERDKIARFDFHHGLSTAAIGEALTNQEAEISCLFIELFDENAALKLAVELRQKVIQSEHWDAPIYFVTQSFHNLDNALNLRSQSKVCKVEAIGPVSVACSLDMITGRQDDFAKKIHSAYLDIPLREEQSSGTFHAHVPWQRLGDDYRDNNRRAADHIRAKLHSMDIPNSKDGLLANPDLLEPLAKLEHDAWNLERRLSGWKVGERNDKAKTHPNLVPYEQLTDDIKEYDRAQIRFLNTLLRSETRQ